MSILIKGIDMPNSGQIELIIRPHGKVLTKTRGIYAKAMQIDLVRCGECKYLEVINKAPIYAHCHKWNYDFELWQEDTRANFCSWGERRADEHNT